jgi:hypothetical protein
MAIRQIPPAVSSFLFSLFLALVAEFKWYGFRAAVVRIRGGGWAIAFTKSPNISALAVQYFSPSCLTPRV